MSTVNKVILVGFLGKDPELRYTPSGTAVVTFPVATNRSYKDRTTGERVEQTQWHNVKVWAGQAETCEKYLTKGRQVFVEGRIESSTFEQDGVTKYWFEIVADAVRFLGSGKAANKNEAEAVAQYADTDIPF